MILEGDNDRLKIVGYASPRKGKCFQDNEIRNVFLTQTMDSPIYEDSDREVLSKYLDTVALPVEVSGQVIDNGARSVYKYKPVALKTRPVVQELPAEFRIKREIIGDPLEVFTLPHVIRAESERSPSCLRNCPRTPLGLN